MIFAGSHFPTIEVSDIKEKETPNFVMKFGISVLG